jgi:lipid-A-disaccharide synthase
VRHLLRRIREAVDAVIAAEPDALVIIDSPEFSHRSGSAGPGAGAAESNGRSHVAPGAGVGVRPGRQDAAYVDHVLALLPFEPEAYRRLGRPACTFVGHPTAVEVVTLRSRPSGSRAPHDEPAAAADATRQPGGEVGGHLAVFDAAAGIVRDTDIALATCRIWSSGFATARRGRSRPASSSKQRMAKPYR